MTSVFLPTRGSLLPKLLVHTRDGGFVRLFGVHRTELIDQETGEVTEHEWRDGNWVQVYPKPKEVSQC